MDERQIKKAVAKREDEALAYMIEGSCEIKRAVVEEDPKEHGVRALLNFGHTLGHSIEKLMNFFSCTWRVCRSRFLTGSGYILPKSLSW